MKLTIKILLLAFSIFTTFTFAQNSSSQKDSTSKPTITRYNLSGDNQLFPEEHSFRITPEISFQNFNLLIIKDSLTVWMRTRMAIMKSGLGLEDKPVNVSDMLHPYLNFYLESKNISLFRRVLGIAQLGAVGYMAYKHIKKYGLFHQQ